jgi:hypothetical protein
VASGKLRRIDDGYSQDAGQPFTLSLSHALRLVSFSSKETRMSNGKLGNASEQARKARLADALRDNLKRRKQQARERKGMESEPSTALPQSGHGGVIDPAGSSRNES